MIDRDLATPNPGRTEILHHAAGAAEPVGGISVDSSSKDTLGSDASSSATATTVIEVNVMNM